MTQSKAQSIGVSTMENNKKDTAKNKFNDHGLNVPEDYFESIESRVLQDLHSEQKCSIFKRKSQVTVVAICCRSSESTAGLACIPTQ